MTSTVPPGRISLHRYPGTSCLATISLSLRDKTISLSLRDKAIRPSKRQTIILALMWGINPIRWTPPDFAQLGG